MYMVSQQSSFQACIEVVIKSLEPASHDDFCSILRLQYFQKPADNRSNALFALYARIACVYHTLAPS